MAKNYPHRDNDYYISKWFGIVAFVGNPEYEEFPIPQGSLTHMGVTFKTLEEAEAHIVEDACNYSDDADEKGYDFAILPFFYVRKRQPHHGPSEI